MGSLLGNLLLARQALEQALCCQPNYWPALESMATVLYALGDFTGTGCKVACDDTSRSSLSLVACLHVIGRGLELDAGFPRGRSVCSCEYLEVNSLPLSSVKDWHTCSTSWWNVLDW